MIATMVEKHIHDIHSMDSLAGLYQFSIHENAFVVGTDDYGGIKPEPIDYSAYVYFHKQGNRGLILLMNGLLQSKDKSVFFQAEEEIANLLYESFL
jgi:hypothetical protein